MLSDEKPSPRFRTYTEASPTSPLIERELPSPIDCSADGGGACRGIVAHGAGTLVVTPALPIGTEQESIPVAAGTSLAIACSSIDASDITPAANGAILTVFW